MFKKIIIIIIALLFFNINVYAEKDINVHLFYREGCPHCEEEKEFFTNYLKENKDVHLYKYDVINDQDAIKLYFKAQDIIEKKTSSVPLLVIGNQKIIGYASHDTTGKNIEKIIEYYRINPYRDLLGEEIGLVEKNEQIILPKIDVLSGKINVPIFGEIDPKTTSLPLMAIVIGFIDGFNPCAMWILIFLITMLFGMKDRKKMWILGLTFLFVSAFAYFLFMISWLNVAKYMGQIIYLRIIISLIALIFGLINLKKYFQKEADGCEVVDDKKRKTIMLKIKKIVSAKSFILSLIGISSLALIVNVIELLCSLGLPVLYTQIIAMNQLNGSQYYLYILIYILFFLLDDLIIFLIAMKTLKIKAISNKYTKYSHLVGAIIMLIIAILMLFKPEWLMFNI